VEKVASGGKICSCQHPAGLEPTRNNQEYFVSLAGLIKTYFSQLISPAC